MAKITNIIIHKYNKNLLVFLNLIQLLILILVIMIHIFNLLPVKYLHVIIVKLLIIIVFLKILFQYNIII